MAVSVFDLFKIGIGPSQLAHGRPDARGAHVRAAAARTTALLRTRGARAGRAVRLARRHRQGPRHRQGGAAGPGGPRARHASTSTPIPALLAGDPRRSAPARCSAATTIAFDETQRPACSTAARRCRSTPTACASPPSTPTARRSPSAPTTRSAAASSSATRWRPTARAHKAGGARHHRAAASRSTRGARAARAARDERHCSIAELMRRNERHWRDDAEIDAGLDRIWHAMQACVARGCAHRRRAARRLQGAAPRAGAARRADRASPTPRCAIR